MDDLTKEPSLKPTVVERLNNVLNLDPTESTAVVPRSQDILIDQSPDKEMQDDFERARRMMNELAGKSMELVHDANFFAKEKQDSKSVEAAAIALGAATTIAKNIMDLHKTRKDIERVSSVSPGGGDTNITQNSAVFVGTTGELLKLTKDMNADGLLRQALTMPNPLTLTVPAAEEDGKTPPK